MNTASNEASTALAGVSRWYDGPVAGPRLLRCLDVALAAMLMVPLALPLVLLRRRWQNHAATGRHGVTFARHGLALPAGHAGRLLAALGAGHWPVLINLLRGDMAWVGPRPRTAGEATPAACLAVRPGLVNPWFIRRRTAVDFGTEAEADQHYLAHRGVRFDLGLLLRGALVALLPPPGAAVGPGRVRRGRVQLGDVVFDNLNMNEAVDRLRDMLDDRRPQQVSFVNPACVNVAASHRGYRRALARAALVLPDGIGTKIGSDLLGTPLKQNVNGTDLFPRLCDMLQARGASLFLLGGQPGVAERVAAQIGRQWPGLRVAGLRHGFFTVAEEGEVVATVRASGADVLLVARGAPSQDLFIDRHLPLLGVRLALGVGGLFDFVSGRIARAPLWMRETGLEWAWRLAQEPGRLWRRYLLGNVSFLARVLLQRLGLRRPAADVRPPVRPPMREAPGPVAPSGVRAVVFATVRAPADVPVTADTPAALLPLGCQSVIEQLLANLAQAAIPEVDLVVCDQPEALRARLGDGSRWGLRLHWHLVKDPQQPYAVLAGAALRGARRVVIGHADHCVTVPALLRLAQAEELLLDSGGDHGPGWTGWASLAPSRLDGLATGLATGVAIGLATGLQRPALATALAAAAVPPRVGTASDGVDLRSAAALQRAQPGSQGEIDPACVPASWIRRPWGAMSPQARVDPGAVITGPVLVGPGCVVEGGARLGPGLVLSENVVVSNGTQVDNSLVLPRSYIGSGLELSHSIVNGARVRHLRLGVEITLATADAMLLSLAAAPRQGSSWAGRATAALLLALAGPALLWHLVRRRWAGQSAAWVLRPMVSGRDGQSQALRLTPLRMPRPQAGGAARAWAGLAGLMDVAGGRRRWFGTRPRTPGQWYALRPEWQLMLADRMVGLLHATAWQDGPALQAEACAVADVYATVMTPLQRARLLVLAGWHLLRPPLQRSARAVVGPAASAPQARPSAPR